MLFILCCLTTKYSQCQRIDGQVVLRRFCLSFFVGIGYYSLWWGLKRSLWWCDFFQPWFKYSWCLSFCLFVIYHWAWLNQGKYRNRTPSQAMNNSGSGGAAGDTMSPPKNVTGHHTTFETPIWSLSNTIQAYTFYQRDIASIVNFPQKKFNTILTQWLIMTTTSNTNTRQADSYQHVLTMLHDTVTQL